MPKKGGNQFYRDKTDYSKFCVSLCGAPITDRDVDYRTAGTKVFQKWNADHQGETCAQCLALRAEGNQS